MRASTRRIKFVMSRPASSDERARMTAFVDMQKSMVASGTPANADTSLAEFCQVLLCLK